MLVGIKLKLKIWINDNYGGNRPFLRYYLNKIKGRFGGYHYAEKVNWSKVNRLVFVCRGNICRSPYAEYIARKNGKSTSSFGLITRTGKSVNADARRNALLRGVDLSGHKAITIDDFEFFENDLLISMEPWQMEETRKKVSVNGIQHTLLGLWAKEYFPYLPDPYGKSDVFFQRCFSMIESSMDSIESNMTQ